MYPAEGGEAVPLGADVTEHLAGNGDLREVVGESASADGDGAARPVEGS